MRVLILPLVFLVASTCINVTSFSQASCASPQTIATLNGSCVDVTPPAAVGGNTSAVCGYASGGSYTWIRFHPSSNTACVSFNISNNSNTTVRTEVAMYHPTTTGGACPGGLNSGQSICFPDGSGIWTPGPQGSGYTWPNYSSNSANANYWYYLRIYTETAITPTQPPPPLPAINPLITVCGTEVTAPPNDNCSGASQIDQVIVSANNSCAKGGTTEIFNSNPGWVCAGVLHNTAWYKFKINDPNNPTIISFSGSNCDYFSGSGSAQIQAGLLYGTCTSAGIRSLYKPSPPAAPNTPTCVQTNATTASLTVPANTFPNGTTVYLAIDGYNGSNCRFNLQTVNAIPIPVRLRHFLVFKAANYNLVRWVTATELNNAYFDIERSADGINYEPIGRVQGAINSVSDINYKFEDYNPPLFAYYRLKQVDLDGKYDYSNVVVIRRDIAQSGLDLIFQNPVENSSNRLIIMAPQNGPVNVRIVDAAGRDLGTQIFDCGKGNNSVIKDYSRLVPGSYFMVVTQNESKIVKPFIKR